MKRSSHGAIKRTREDLQVYKSADYSGFFERLFACCIDIVILAGIGYLLYRRFGLVFAVLSTILLDLVLRIVMTHLWGGTLGKLVFGLRVVSRCSHKLSIWQVAVRELFKYFSGLFMDFGYISIMLNRRKMSWHDLAACTAVTSGGREEAEYARDIYTEKPERWRKWIWTPMTAVLMIGLLVGLNMESNKLLYEEGMMGFSYLRGFPETHFSYIIPPTAGSGGFNKNVIQLGDIDGDGGYEVFREGLVDGKIFIRSLRTIGKVPIDGDIILDLDKPVIQYRLLDLNNDKKDELAVLFEDFVLKIYKMDGEITELGSYGPLEYKEVISVIRGKPADNGPSKLYVLGDSNKLTIISMKDESITSEMLDLPLSDSITMLDMGIFDGKNYLTTLTAGGKFVLYSYDGKGYKAVKTMDTLLKGNLSMAIRDINSDKKNEVVIWSDGNVKGGKPVIAAYDISSDKMEIVWNGGNFYNLDGNRLILTPDDEVDTDKNGDIEFYMLSKDIAGEYVKYSVFIFQSNKLMQTANDFMRALSLRGILQ